MHVLKVIMLKAKVILVKFVVFILFVLFIYLFIYLLLFCLISFCFVLFEGYDSENGQYNRYKS